jgi:Tol biopolymer transport system component
MNGISHKQAIQFIHHRMDGLLNEGQLFALDEHLHSCDSCRAYATDMDGLSAHLQNRFHRRWDDKAGPSQKMFEHVTAKAKRISRANRVSSGAKLFAGAIVLILLAVTINFVASRLESTSSVANSMETVDNASRVEDRLLAFTSDKNGNSDIYTMHADGSGLTNITDNPAYEGAPFWSPNGQQIAFMSDREGSNQIYLMDADGSNVVQLTDGEGSYGFDGNGRDPWSPDGSKLIFGYAAPGEKNGRLQVIDITDKSITTLTSEPGQYLHPSWSPDGKQIAFTSDPRRIPQDLFVVASDGSGLAKLTENLPPGEFFMFDYEWSPDGTSIFFITDRNQQAFQESTYTSTVYEASLDGSVSIAARVSDRRLLHWWNGVALLDSPENHLIWLRADGSESRLELCRDDAQILAITYEHSHTGNFVVGFYCSTSGWMLYWSNADGTTIEQLPKLPIPLDEDILYHLTWSPHDQYLAFVGVDTDPPYVAGTLYVLDVPKAREDASTQPVKITGGGSPSWQPVP